MQKLEIGQEVWGYVESPVTVCNTEWQATGSVTRIESDQFQARIGGRQDGTGFESNYKTQQAAMVAAKLPLDQEFIVQSTDKGIFKIKTAFDQD